MDESARLRELTGYGVLDTPPEPNFDRLTSLAAAIFDVPICTLSFADAERHWFKSRFGVDATQMPRKMSFCDQTIGGDAVFVVPDTLADERFAGAPAVVGAPHVRFYAGAPLVVASGAPVGSLCVLDRVPRADFGAKEQRILTGLAETCVELLEARSRQIRLVKRSEEIAYLARHDPLTGLANRRLLGDHMVQALAEVEDGRQIAVLYIDLDHFKPINDRLGHHVGDALLLQVAARLRANVRATDKVARLGGDEFAVVQVGREVRRHAADLAERLIGTLSQPYRVEGHTLSIGASIGIALALEAGQPPEQMIRNADDALYCAKSQGRSTYCFFDGSQRRAAVARSSRGGR